MNRKNSPSLTNIIGILLVAVALVSAGGLVYLASEYSKISDSLVSAEADIPALRLSLSNSTGQVTITVSVTLDNPSDLDLEVYRVEYMTYVDRITSTISGSGRYVGSGATNEGNGTVHAGSLREIQVIHSINPDTIYMERFNFALDGDDTFWIYITGYIWFRISDYPDVTKKLPIYYFGQEVLLHVF